MMKLKYVLSGASAVCLFAWCFHSSDTMAGDSIVVNCDPDIEPGVVIMTNPPKVSCKDLDLFDMFVGTGLKFGPITDMEQLRKQIAESRPPAPVKILPEKTEFEDRRERAFLELVELNLDADQELSDHDRWLRSVAPGYLDDSDLFPNETPVNNADVEGN